MQYSSILVTTVPASFDDCVEGLSHLSGVEVHLRYPKEGRIIVTQESPSVEEQKEGLRRIQSAPHVLTADLVYHYVETEEPPGS
jgi:nitrate reductase NapD